MHIMVLESVIWTLKNVTVKHGTLFGALLLSLQIYDFLVNIKLSFLIHLLSILNKSNFLYDILKFIGSNIFITSYTPVGVVLSYLRPPKVKMLVTAIF